MKSKHIQPTESELAVLKVLWKEGPSTVRTVNEVLNQQQSDKEIGYTTTLKFMQIMYDKGFLSREKQGKMHVYTPLVSEQDTQQQLLDKLVDTAFHGSAMNLVMQALGNRRSSPQELEEIRNFLDTLDNSSKHSNK